MTTELFRQGDILIKKISQIPKSIVKRKNNIILEGEATGHSHKMNYGSIYDYNGAVYLEAFDNASITHNEHQKIPLEKGLYQVIQQREADPIDGSLRDWHYTKD